MRIAAGAVGGLKAGALGGAYVFESLLDPNGGGGGCCGLPRKSDGLPEAKGGAAECCGPLKVEGLPKTEGGANGARDGPRPFVVRMGLH